jgi:hypothetical protein
VNDRWEGIEMPSPENVNRREFAKAAAAGAVPVIAALTAGAAEAQEQQTEPSKPPSPAERLLELVQQQYPDKRLDAAGLAEVREDVDALLARSARLSAFPLTNGDEPGFLVRAFRKD